MALPSELRSSLPSSIDPESVRAAVRAPGSPGSLGGETWLLDIEGRLAVVIRASIFDGLEPVALREEPKPVELRDGPALEVRPAEGDAFVLRPSLFEVDAIQALLREVDGVATLAAKELAPSEARRDPVTLTDLDVIDSNLEAEVREALAAGEFDRVVAAAREIARQSSPRERDAWHDLVEIVTLMRAGAWEAAYLWTRGVRRIPALVEEPAFNRLRRELLRHDHPALAWAALGELGFDDSAVEQRQQLEAQIGRDGPTLAREVAGRAREFFSARAETDRLAQRGLARALFELDELDAALTWIRRAIAGERFDFDARMLETQILGAITTDRDDDRELVAALRQAAADFHDRPEPLVDLADHLEFDDAPAAIELLREAQEREFDELTLLALLELLEANGRHAEVIREAEQALDDPDSIELVKDQVLAKLAAARAQLALAPTGLTLPSQAVVGDAPGKTNVVAVIVIAVVAVVALVALGLF